MGWLKRYIRVASFLDRRLDGMEASVRAFAFEYVPEKINN